MGAFYNSICLPGSRGDAVRAALVRWLRLRGFEPVPGPVLFDLDADRERSAFVLRHARWTVLFYSDYEEEARLVRELRTVASPLLYLWVYDSSSWGYDLFDQGAFAGSYNSEPRDHESFPDRPLDDPARPAADPARVAALLGDAALAPAIAAVERRGAARKEDLCRAFARLLGLEAAVASYDDLECGQAAAGDGWRVEQIRFLRRDRLGEQPRVDLHQQRVTHRNLTGGALETGTLEIPTQVLLEMQRTRRRIRLTLMVLRPVSWLARRWRQLSEAFDRFGREVRVRRQLERMTAVTGRTPTYRVEGSALINDRHRCRIELPAGVRPALASSKPASVFAFEARGVHVTCTARRLEAIKEVLRRPDQSKVTADRKYRVAGRKARHLLFRLPAGFRADVPGTSYLGLSIVQTEQAFYVFLYRYAREPIAAVEAAIRATVASFRLLEK